MSTKERMTIVDMNGTLFLRYYDEAGRVAGEEILGRGSDFRNAPPRRPLDSYQVYYAEDPRYGALGKRFVGRILTVRDYGERISVVQYVEMRGKTEVVYHRGLNKLIKAQLQAIIAQKPEVTLLYSGSGVSVF